jgi:hypothetical protein
MNDGNIAVRLNLLQRFHTNSRKLLFLSTKEKLKVVDSALSNFVIIDDVIPI